MTGGRGWTVSPADVEVVRIGGAVSVAGCQEESAVVAGAQLVDRARVAHASLARLELAGLQAGYQHLIRFQLDLQATGRRLLRGLLRTLPDRGGLAKEKCIIMKNMI